MDISGVSPIEILQIANEVVNTIEAVQSMQSTGKTWSLEEQRRKHPNAYSKWTCDEDARLNAAYSAGKSIQELSIIHGRSLGAIKSRLNKHGFEFSYRRAA